MIHTSSPPFYQPELGRFDTDTGELSSNFAQERVFRGLTLPCELNMGLDAGGGTFSEVQVDVTGSSLWLKGINLVWSPSRVSALRGLGV